MSAMLTFIRSALRRRRLQAFAIATVLAVASGAATIALDVLIESQAPFDTAFAQANGAHLVVTYDAGTTADELAATRSAAHVTDAAGPWLVGVAGFLANPGDVVAGHGPAYFGQQISARPDPNTSVDRIALDAGRWWQAPGEIVVSRSWADRGGVSVGGQITLQQAATIGKPGSAPIGQTSNGPTSAPLTRAVTVVGIAESVSTPAVAGWMSPDDVSFLSPGLASSQQMLYRLDPAATPADLAQALQSITAAAPNATLDGSVSYLTLRESSNRTAAIFAPILLAFALFALGAATFIIVNVVSGIVLASYRQIGVMKAVGFTPGQVTGVLVGEIFVPSTAGALVGVLVGAIAGISITQQTAQAFGLPTPVSGTAEIALAVVLGVTVLTTVSALIPAARAGRLRAAETIARGVTPAGGRIGALHRLALRLPLSLSARLGVATSIAHPLRALMSLGALVVGVAAIVFAVGLNGSLRVVAPDLLRDVASPVRFNLEMSSYPAAQVTEAIASNTSTSRYVASADEPVVTPQLGAVPFVAYQGDSSWLGYALIHGRWFNGPDEAVAPTNFFTQSGLSVGDHVTLSTNGRATAVTLVGEIFDQAEEGHDDLVLRGDWPTLLALDPTATPTSWEVQPVGGADRFDYGQAIGDSVDNAVSVDFPSDSATDHGFLLFEGVIAILGIVLVLVSLAGVFNTVLLETRQRVRETAVLKSLGMTPRGVVSMVVARIVPIGLVAGIIGVPLGLIVQSAVLHSMAQAAILSDVPQSVVSVLPVTALVLLGLSGLLIAALGALVPAMRSARAQIAPILQAE
jgi:putative ABC transport system permease protein